MNHNAVCRTSPASPGLLKVFKERGGLPIPPKNTNPGKLWAGLGGIQSSNQLENVLFELGSAVKEGEEEED